MVNRYLLDFAQKVLNGVVYIKDNIYIRRPISPKMLYVPVNYNHEVHGVYLIATKRGLFTLEDNKLWKILNGRFYGITIRMNKAYVFERIGNLGGRIIKLSFDQDYVFDKKCNVVIDGLSTGCHQIDFIDDRLFVMDTYNNRVLVYDMADLSSKSYYPLGLLDNGRASDNYGHLNSIYKVDDKFYLMCHNSSSKTGKRSEILVLDADMVPIRKIDTGASNAHNIIVDENKLIYCDSAHNSLKVNGVDVFEGKHFTRGLSVSDDHVLLGGSEYAERNMRTRVNGCIYVLDHKYNLFTHFMIPGMVQEIRRIDKPDVSLSKYSSSNYSADISAYRY